MMQSGSRYRTLSHTSSRSVRRISANRSRWPAHEIADHDEADEEGEERGPDLLQGSLERLAVGQLGDVDLEHEQGDDDRDDPVGQCQDARGIVLSFVPLTSDLSVHRRPSPLALASSAS
jgi:hypothetical protein